MIKFFFRVDGHDKSIAISEETHGRIRGHLDTKRITTRQLIGRVRKKFGSVTERRINRYLDSSSTF